MITLEGTTNEVEDAMDKAEYVRAFIPQDVDDKGVGEHGVVFLKGNPTMFACFGGRHLDMLCKVVEVEKSGLRLAFVRCGTFQGAKR